MRPLGDDSGFTLLEILVAMVVLSLGLLGTTSLTLTILRSNTFSNKVTTATTLVQDQLEDIRRAGFAAAASRTEDYGSIPNPNANTDYSSYQRVTTVTSTPAAPATPVMKTVTVTVSWRGVSARSVTLMTILAQ